MILNPFTFRLCLESTDELLASDSWYDIESSEVVK